MDAPERPQKNLPTPLSAGPLAKSTAPWEEWADPGAEASPPKLLTLKVALRAARRHWWQILGLWLVGSALIVPLVYYKIKPVYESFALLKIEQGSRSINAPSSDQGSSTTYLETQVQLITSANVLGAALQDPKVAALPRYRGSIDAESDLRRDLKVGIVPKTNLIQVAMSSLSPTESAIVVNAVVASYVKAASTWVDEETKAEINRLTESRDEFKKQVEDRRRTINELLAKRSIKDRIEEEKEKVSLDTYRALNVELGTAQMERDKAESVLTYLETLAQREGRGLPLSGKALTQAAEARFVRTPEAVRLAAEMREAEDQLDKASRAAKLARDPVVQRAKSELAALDGQWHALWDQMRSELEAQISSAADGGIEGQLRDARLRVAEAKENERVLRKRLGELKVSVQEEVDSVKIQLDFARADELQASEALAAVNRHLNQIEYESKRSTKTNLILKAMPNARPSSDHRMKLMAAVPVVLLMGLVGLFVLVEARSGRVADPDDLPSRVKLGVLGVVPPLPTLSPPRGARAARNERRRVEEFVQSLDHLRVTLCSGQPGLGARRCVLITSATGGEGKTTLAAQLAGRCANAGLLTLLIDADLRRPSLGELLEVPEGPGLADVLAEEATPEEAMVVIGNAGGFHLLPAGTPPGDPSRLLQGERLASLIARSRETFDVVIIDAPPVLAVPDALILGRWVDGAILAVRHDTSRFPLVERANRRLTAIGIPVLGAVVNGVRPMEATYGGYGYSYSYSSHDDPAADSPTS